MIYWRRLVAEDKIPERQAKEIGEAMTSLIGAICGLDKENLKQWNSKALVYRFLECALEEQYKACDIERQILTLEGVPEDLTIFRNKYPKLAEGDWNKETYEKWQDFTKISRQYK